MGFTPEQVDRMTLWQFLAVVEGWRLGHGGKKPAEHSIDYTDAQLRAMGIDV